MTENVGDTVAGGPGQALDLARHPAASVEEALAAACHPAWAHPGSRGGATTMRCPSPVVRLGQLALLALYTLISRRAFAIGDRVKIGDVVGDVIEMRPQVTHLRSPKN
jgi:hypothetical protein